MKKMSTILGLLALAATLPAIAEDSWTQWGGAHQDFKAASSDLAKKWGEDGPKKLWSREIGEGYSAVLVEDGKLYTMHRVGDEHEAVVALDAASGKTLWETKYEASPREGHVDQFGRGPRATPLLVGDRLFTIGVAGHLHALDKKTGKILWQQDLWGEHGGTFLNFGYSSSPIRYKDMVIALVGGDGKSVMAFDQKDGTVKWQAHSFANSYSTPHVFEVGGEPHLVTFMAEQIIGLDPDTGELEWSLDHTNQWKQNINVPVLVDGRYLFLSSPQAGARGLELTRQDGKVKAEEIWSTRKIQFYHVTSVLEGGDVYGSTGTQVNFMASVDVKTGEIHWRERGIAKANVVQADGKLYILDENGVLYLTTATPEKLTIHSKVELLDKPAWTVPTIVGKTMYVRDKDTLMALDLG